MFFITFRYSVLGPGSGVVLDLSIPDLCLIPYFGWKENMVYL